MARKGMVVTVVALMVAGCSSTAPTNGQIYGTAGGAAVGAGIGRAVAATATQGTWVGALGGALVGYAAGSYVDGASEEKHARATIAAAEDGEAVSWTEGGDRGLVSPLGAQYADRSGRPCRNLKQDADFGEQKFMRDVTACQAKDGTWVVTEYRPDPAD
ncbi:hypothetical protein [Magnetospirillum aberrantis]|uniref:17 kDa surface antigen n=1 Tax=Magnetospirillum aberrantis SpK TaxID=908842 RepID=A0A7C9V014_9PROT|nr:hypothetical protein [Magnetospirillum aberrantis]NFV80814.1 hypothetical protein [Magnetospirillum aberrantis SpK]